MSHVAYRDSEGRRYWTDVAGNRVYENNGHQADVADGAESSTSMPSPKAPMQVARTLVQHHYTDQDALTLRWWRGAFYRWERGRWGELEDKVVRSSLYRHLEHATFLDDKGEPKPWAPNRYKVADVADALIAVGPVETATTPPAWLARRTTDPPAHELVSVANGLLHVPTRELHSHTPRLWNTVSVPFDYMRDATMPTRWLRFLDQLWPDDVEAIAALQEWFGYVVSGDTRLHKIMFVVGPLRSGKGTIARILAAMIGRQNMTGPTLASLGTQFGLQDLIGKTLAVIADARLAAVNANVVVERLLSISGEDTLTVDRKYRDPWTGQLGTRFLIISNELPSFGDASGAIASRFVVLTLAHSWLGKENHALTAELLEELPGILNWSLDGLDRLRQNGRFTEPASSRDAIVALSDLVSPVSAFVRDACEIRADGEVPVDELYDRWKEWCEDQGRDRAGTKATFGKHLRAAVPGVRRFRPEGEDKSRPYFYAGIRLRQQSPVPRTYQDATPEDVPVLDRPSDSPLLSLGDVHA